MNNDSKDPDCSQATVLRMEDLRTRKSQKGRPVPVRVKVEVSCQEPVGETIRSCLSSRLESFGCLVVGDDRPDWILSMIAFSHEELVELSIILRKLFPSTVPGTEVDRVDADGQVVLRKGGWLYESLRFHGLFGVQRAELTQFLERLVNDLAGRHWERPVRTWTNGGRKP